MKNLLLLMILLPTIALSQVWEKTYENGAGYSVEQTTDGGFIVIGSGIYYSRCIYMIKTDLYGDTLWTKHHSITTTDLFCSGHQTTDGGYIITGATRPENSFYYNVFLLKTNSSGDTLWSNEYGGSKDDLGFSVQQTSDKGYIITGWSDSFSSNHNVYLIKTDSIGGIMWSETYGDDNFNTARSVVQTIDGGYFITGYSYIYGSGFSWINLIKTDSIGNVLWTTTFDEDNEDFGISGKQTNDGGYIVTGSTEQSNNISDLLLLKTNSNGDIDWVKTFGDYDYYESGNCVQQTNDGGYIITGSKKTNSNFFDVYLIKTDNSGEALWTKTFGGVNSDKGLYVQQTSDEGYIISGEYQDDNDARFVYLIKTDENGIITFTREIAVSNHNRKLIKTIDLSGKEIIKPKRNQPYIEIYDDGTTQKKLILK